MAPRVLAAAAVVSIFLALAFAAVGEPAVAAVPPGLTPCQYLPEAYCGSLQVPLDRTGVVPGKTRVRFEWHAPTDAAKPQIGTIVAIEGGPGYGTTESRDYYLELFRPIMGRRGLLLVDQRGTGRSQPLDCPEAQSYDGNWVANAEACGARLGPLSDLYTSPAAAADLEVVLDALGVPAVDLYGDSYGSFLAQTFAVRYPQRVRTLLLDGTYPIEGLDPWYRTTPVRLRENLALFCARSPLTCPVTPDRVLARVRKAVELLRASPLTTSAPGGDGSETDVTLTPRRVADVLLYSDSAPGYVRESIAAVEALLAGNPRPLARMVAESEVDPADAAVRRTPRAELRGYSEGAYLAYACSDYPQLWNVNASFPARENQFAAAVGGLAPGAVSPWTSTEWADTEFFTYDYCLHWPKPRVVDPPFPAGGRYPSTPTLVLNGDLDLRTDLYQAREVSANFPRSSYVQVPNAGHVTALYDADSCASSIARTFVETRAMGGTGCLAHIPEHRIVQRFAEAAADAPPADVASGADRSRPADRRASRVAVEALADVIDRWYAIPGFGGSGLYGGKFTMTSTDTSPFASRVWTLALKKLKWTQDVEVSGIATVPRGPGTASASLTVKGAGTDAGDLTVTWSTRQPGAKARIRGTIGGRAVDLSTPAPSFY